MAKRRKRSNDDTTLFEDLPTATGGDNGSGGDRDVAFDSSGERFVPLHETARTKYLNYALSVITSRALPDVRDGLKPVHRRIIFTMYEQRLTADAKHRKCANVVGEVMGRYHPHGDTAIYDALVRMAQPFSLRATLVDGSGNFGSLDGDPPAAYRYTECRLTPLSNELLDELNQNTVDRRANYDNTRTEPIVLPARFPNLLVNGATGIAVGMATNIPPHNLVEVVEALIKLLDALVADKELSSRQLCRWVKGPDFPTGGHILSTAEEIKEIYETGGGSIRIRGTHEIGKVTRGSKTLFITSIPYGVNKAALVERIGDIVVSRKMPLLLNVRDLSTDDVRIELELKNGADEHKVLAYLYKHTPLQTNFAVNLTCLLPTSNPEVGRPKKSNLREILWYFLRFREEVVTRRLEHELGELNRRIHILEGFETVFDALDEIIRIIRKSDGKADAAAKIMKRFELDAEQTDAILELKLYRLARLEILVIREELEKKRKRAKEIEKLLKSEEDRWKLVRSELEDILKTYGKLPEHKRRTIIEAVEDEPEFSEDDFIIAEDAVVIVTRDGWVKRQKEVKDLSTQRLREGDAVIAAEPGSTRSTIAFFSNLGTCYTARIADVPATTGYGEPIQKLFKLKDGERIVQAMTMDKRYVGDIVSESEEYAPLDHAVGVTSDGYSMRFGIDAFVEPSTRNGRRFARVRSGAHVVGVEKIHGSETLIAATHKCRALLCAAEEVNYLSGPGKGVILVKLAKDDYVIGFVASTGERDLLRVETNRGAEKTVSTAKYEVTSRGGRGRELQKHGTLVKVIRDDITAPVIMDTELEE